VCICELHVDVIQRPPLSRCGREGLVRVAYGVVRPRQLDVHPAVEELVHGPGEVMLELGGEGLG